MTNKAVITKYGIRWNTHIDDISINAAVLHDLETWSYQVVKGTTAITPEIHSKTPPYADAQRGRDTYIRKALDRQSIYTGSIDDVMNSFNDFVLSVSSSMVRTYFKSIDSQTDEYIETEYTVEAEEILKNGDPIKYIMDTYNSIHKGDIETGKLLILSIGSQCVRNTKGIQPKLSGESGKGKTHACQTVLHLVPEDYWVETSLSGKGLFYADIEPGTIIFSDDATVGEDLESTIKRSTTNFQKKTFHLTVDSNRKSAKLNVPARILWWLTSVDDDMSTQTINRLFGVPVDESEDMDQIVMEFELEKAETGEDDFPVNKEVLVCREIFRIIKEHFFRVVIPFSKDIVWADKKNRRNLSIFLDVVRSFTVYRFLQRDHIDETSIVATVDDFEDARVLYSKRGETQTTKLTPLENRIIRFISQTGDVDSAMLQTAMNITRARVSQIMRGQRNDKGLLSKYPGLRVRDITDRDGDRTTRRKMYEVVNFNPLEDYLDIVSLNGNH